MIEIHIHVHFHSGASSGKSASPSGSVRKGSTSFFHYMSSEVRRMASSGRYSTSRNYATALRSFRTFCSVSNLSFRSVTPSLLSDYENWLKRRGICLNTISCYLRSLRAVYNRGVSQGLAEQTHPFRKVYTGVERTVKRGVGQDVIQRLQALTLSCSSLSLVRDMFIFSFLACGMPFVDMAYLTKSQIHDGYLVYRRHKTGRRIRIKLQGAMSEIIRRYAVPGRDYVFPVIKSGAGSVQAYSQYRSGVSYYNRQLKKLALLAGCSQNLTSYVTRHSWASMAYADKVGLPVISKALGHTLPQTTLIYVRDINDTALDSANKRIINKIFGKKKVPPLFKNSDSQ